MTRKCLAWESWGWLRPSASHCPPSLVVFSMEPVGMHGCDHSWAGAEFTGWAPRERRAEELIFYSRINPIRSQAVHQRVKETDKTEAQVRILWNMWLGVQGSVCLHSTKYLVIPYGCIWTLSLCRGILLQRLGNPTFSFLMDITLCSFPLQAPRDSSIRGSLLI